METRRYPESEMAFGRALPTEWTQFADYREELLLDYSYNTARAYWADLQDIFEWAVRHERNVIKLTGDDVRQYVALLRRRKYSEHTIRRRVGTYRALRKLCDADARTTG